MAGLSTTGVIARVDLFNLGAPGTDTDILQGIGSESARLTPRNAVGVFRIGITLGVATSIFKVTENDGSTTVTHLMNSNAALGVSEAFTFIFPFRDNKTYEFQVSGATTTILKLQIEEVDGGVI